MATQSTRRPRGRASHRESHWRWPCAHRPPALRQRLLSECSCELVVKLLGFCVIDRHHETSAALERHLDDNQTTFFDSLHGSITGSGLHCCHDRILLIDLLSNPHYPRKPG